MDKHRSILEFSNDEAMKFFLKTESYSNLDLPPYFVFNDLLKNVAEIVRGKNFSDFQSEKPRDNENVNYTLFNNKDGKYAWRPMQLIHPAIYVSLVDKITQSKYWDTIKSRFVEFNKNKRIICLSLPVESLSDEKDKAELVSQWWQAVEQRSIELAMDFEYILHTDIADCYGSIYTHSIAWALHSKDEAKKKENRNNFELIGVVIDNCIQDMSYGQTNGIPQGSVLMDFVAEMVLGFADLELSEKISKTKIENYFILRYRDDYRIFVNNPQDGEHILKLITETMIDLGMKLNPSKTISSNDVIRSSIKSDKLKWLEKSQTAKSLQKHLLIIHNHSKEFSNSGSLIVALSDFYKRLRMKKKVKESAMPMISIVVDIAFHNPKTYPITSAILSKLIALLDSDDDRRNICKKIERKFKKIPNTGYMHVWLQRFSMFFVENLELNESLSRLVSNSEIKLWNNSWISNKELKNLLDKSEIVDHGIKKGLKSVIEFNEIELFITKATEYY